ncbi:MAG: hypothetical protein WD648_11435 [Planctomycetaceae bacterium]
MKKLMSLLVLASVSMFVLGCSEGEKKKTESTVKKTTETTKPADKTP